MGNMVIKETNGSGGYGMVMGNKASKRKNKMLKFIVKESTNTQPIIQLSTVPCFIDGELKLRHVDLHTLCGD
jgi:uncharacterized circularly permuted ATP-grasp superfamily protein